MKPRAPPSCGNGTCTVSYSGLLYPTVSIGHADIQASCPEERPRHFLPALARPVYPWRLVVPIPIRHMIDTENIPGHRYPRDTRRYEKGCIQRSAIFFT